VLAAASTLGLFRSGSANAFFVALGEGFFVPVVIVPAGDGHADDFFDIAQVFELVFRTERNGTTFGSSTRGAADAMHVGFGFVREIEVDHQTDVFDVNATSGNIGGDEHWGKALFEALQGFFALSL
jgi:hypothetical protein